MTGPRTDGQLPPLPDQTLAALVPDDGWLGLPLSRDERDRFGYDPAAPTHGGHQHDDGEGGEEQ